MQQPDTTVNVATPADAVEAELVVQPAQVAVEVAAEDQTPPTGVDSKEPEAVELVQRGGMNSFTNVATGEPVSLQQVAQAEAAQTQAVNIMVGNSVNVAPPVPSGGEFELSLGASATARIVMHELKDYIEAMSVKKIIPADKGAGHQAGLYRALLGAVNSSDEDFKEVMTLTLKLINAHSDNVFDAKNVYRFMPHLTLPAPAAKSFRNLVNLFTATANPESRALAVKQINFELTLEGRAIKEEARQRVAKLENVLRQLRIPYVSDLSAQGVKNQNTVIDATLGDLDKALAEE